MVVLLQKEKQQAGQGRAGQGNGKEGAARGAERKEEVVQRASERAREGRWWWCSHYASRLPHQGTDKTAVIAPIIKTPTNLPTHPLLAWQVARFQPTRQVGRQVGRQFDRLELGTNLLGRQVGRFQPTWFVGRQFDRLELETNLVGRLVG